jgi:hypothetical protein
MVKPSPLPAAAALDPAILRMIEALAKWQARKDYAATRRAALERPEARS